MKVEHVLAHRTKKEKKHVSQFERFVTEGNEKAHELAKAGAMLDEGVHRGNKSENCAAGKRGGVCSFTKSSQLLLPSEGIERL